MTERQVLKRRGILAAAGAVVAGIVAKQASVPVAAATGGTQGTALILGANTPTGTANTETSTTWVTNGTVNIGSSYTLDAFLAASQYGTGVTGWGFYTGPGVYGINAGASGTAGDGVAGSSNYGRGVSGASSQSHGVSGTTGTAGTSSVGVYGENTANSGLGVYGVANGGGGFGVQGTGEYGVTGTGTSIGVQGGVTTANGIAIYGVGGVVGTEGLIGSANATANTIGVYGNNLGTGTGTIGVYGSCARGTGVYGQTSASNQYGVLGTTYAPNSTAIAGTCTQNGSSAFSGGTTNPNAFAAFFQGKVVVQGPLVVTDPSYKSGALQHPDGSHRLVYCVESPESWIEDVGNGTLNGGKATVTFDKDFAAVVHTDTYHVFLTEYDGHNNLCVANRTANGFEVHAAMPGGSGTFSWKVMVKAKSAVKSERLGKFVMPNLPLPDPTKFTAPEVPALPTPPSAPPRTTTPPPVQSPPSSPPPGAQPPAASPPASGSAPNPLPAPRT